MQRRTFLQLAATAPLVSSLATRTFSANAPAAMAGKLLVRGDLSPVNLEMPLAGFKDYITPNDLFYVRSHFAAPTINAATWSLRVDQHVGKALKLSYDDLKRLPSKTVTATLECSGNGRSFLEPKKKGVQWEIGAVGNARWTGVPVADVLRRAEIKPGAVDVVFVGADHGKKDDEELQFLRSVPLAKALDQDVLLAYEMNGQPLTVNHGFPLRVIVPGWFGVASVKWLERIIVSDKPFPTYWQSVDYSIWDRRTGVPRMQPITLLQVKSVIANPAAGATFGASTNQTISGTAWSGDADVTKVEVSTDDGRTWNPADLIDPPAKGVWRRWRYSWRTPSKPGEVKLFSRATDAAGNQQPTDRDDGRRNYLINHLVPVAVEIR
jgi:DMSO/TMAO reductase YedYZ molybdopterin-dependent catalytic subunit